MDAPAPRTPARERRTLAQWWCLLGGWTLLLVGLVGFTVNSSFDTGSHVMGDDLIVFMVNGWHNLVHIASGLFLLAGAGKRRRAKWFALLFGVAYGVVAIAGLVNGSEVFSLIPVDAADNALHVVLSLVSLIAGLISRSRYDWQRSTAYHLRARMTSHGGRAGHGQPQPGSAG